jgi:hypothetical protein
MVDDGQMDSRLEYDGSERDGSGRWRSLYAVANS